MEKELKAMKDATAEKVVGGTGVGLYIVCPACGSTNVKYFGVDPISHLNEYQCNDCGHDWESTS